MLLANEIAREAVMRVDEAVREAGPKAAAFYQRPAFRQERALRVASSALIESVADPERIEARAKLAWSLAERRRVAHELVQHTAPLEVEKLADFLGEIDYEAALLDLDHARQLLGNPTPGRQILRDYGRTARVLILAGAFGWKGADPKKVTRQLTKECKGRRLRNYVAHVGLVRRLRGAFSYPSTHARAVHSAAVIGSTAIVHVLQKSYSKLDDLYDDAMRLGERAFIAKEILERAVRTYPVDLSALQVELACVNPAFGGVPVPTIEAAIQQLTLSKRTGRGHIGVVRALAELASECGALEFPTHGGEASLAAIKAHTKWLNHAITRHLKVPPQGAI